MKRKMRRNGVIAAGVVLSIGLLCLPGIAKPGVPEEEPAPKTTLENGLTIILEKDESSATTVLQIVIRGGKRGEPPRKRGLSFLTTRLTVEIPDSGKAQELVSLATRFSVTALGDHSLVNIECLSENLEPSLKVLSKIILDPLFSGIRIDSVKRYMEHQGRVEEDDSVRLGHLASLGALFAGTPYEGSIYGDGESLKAIKNKDVSDFYKSHFVGSNMILSLSSDLPANTLLDLVKKYFGDIPKGKPISLDPTSAPGPEESMVHIERDTKQTYVCLAYRLPEVSPRNYALTYLLENILGKGPGSRLWPLRSEKKLAYNVNCRAAPMRFGGMIEVYLETDNPKMATAKAALQEVVLELHQKGISEEELAFAKTSSVAGFIRENETKTGRVATLAFFESVGLGFDYFAVFPSTVAALSLEEVNAYVRRILAPEGAVEVTIGLKPE